MKKNVLFMSGIFIILLVSCVTNTGIIVDEDYNPVINPSDFTTNIDNQYLPLKPGMVYFYEAKEEGETEIIIVEVTGEIKTVMGVDCVVVRDRAWEEGKLAEDTVDWFAQDNEGNVWYFGEISKEYDEGRFVGLEGSWEAGVDGALPGIVMKANPQVGDAYRQEYLKGEAEDMGEVVALGESVNIPYGSYTNCLKTKDWTPLEASVTEYKYYAPGLGLVMEAEAGARVSLTKVLNLKELKLDDILELYIR